MTAGSDGGANNRSPRPDATWTYTLRSVPSGLTTTSSLSFSLPGRWQADSPDILRVRRTGGVPLNNTRPAIEAVPIDSPAGTAPGGGGGGSSLPPPQPP